MIELVDMLGLGDRIRARRKWLGLKQGELSERVKDHAEGRAVAVETLSRIENGNNEPATWMLAALALALNTTADYLLGLTENPDTPDEPRFPIPSPELASLVVQLNELSPAVRKRIAGVVEGIMDLLSPAPVSQVEDLQLSADLQQLRWLMGNLSPERRAYWEAQILAEAEAAEANHGSSQPADDGAPRAVNS